MFSAELVGIVPRIDLVHALPSLLRPKQLATHKQQQRGQKRTRTQQGQQAADQMRLHSLAGEVLTLVHDLLAVCA